MNEHLLRAVEQSSFTPSDFAEGIDRLFFGMLAVCTLMTLAITVLIVAFCIRYRRGKNGDQHRGRTAMNARNYSWVEYSWTGLPLIIFIGLFIWGATLFMQLQQLPRNALVIDVVAKQWMWKFYHPGGQREINELHIPANRPIIVRLASEDVIHSFFVPSFRIKQDVVPGRYTHTWFNVREPGTYRLFCAEYCGTDHSHMRGVVQVMSAEDYGRWLANQQQSPTLAAAGERLFRQAGCSGCHSKSSMVHAPDLAGLFGRVIHLDDGRRLEADRAYVRDSILLPEKDIVAGYPSVMPSFAGQLSEEDVLKLVTYIESLSDIDNAEVSHD